MKTKLAAILSIGAIAFFGIHAADAQVKIDIPSYDLPAIPTSMVGRKTA
ncbi:MAG TPA: hypothetical protein VF194_07740 [Ferrovibrio sp.]